MKLCRGGATWPVGAAPAWAWGGAGGRGAARGETSVWDSRSLDGAVVPTHSGASCLLPTHPTLSPWGSRIPSSPRFTWEPVVGQPREGLRKRGEGGPCRTSPQTQGVDAGPGRGSGGPLPPAQRPLPSALLPRGRNGRDILIIFLPLMGRFLYDAGTPE